MTYECTVYYRHYYEEFSEYLIPYNSYSLKLCSFSTYRDPDKDHYPVVKLRSGKTCIENSDYGLVATNRATDTATPYVNLSIPLPPQPTDGDVVY